jgi:hypothetical protein
VPFSLAGTVNATTPLWTALHRVGVGPEHVLACQNRGLVVGDVQPGGDVGRRGRSLDRQHLEPPGLARLGAFEQVGR